MSVFNEKVVVLKRSLFATNLKAAREYAGLTQKEVAEKLGKARHTAIANWENDRSTPSLKYFVELCALYSVTPNDMLLTGQQ